MAQNTNKNNNTGRFAMSTGGWPAERWAAVVVLLALGALIMIRMGFRGVGVLGARVSVS